MFRFPACIALMIGLAACAGPTGLSDPSLIPQVMREKSATPATCWTEVRTGHDLRQGWFRSICPDDMTPTFTAEVQGALAARGYYAGPPDGQAVSDLGAAIQRYQSDRGLPSPVLSYRAAQQLGLKPWIEEN